MRIAMVDLPYSYGKQRPFLNGSLVAATARLRSAKHEVSYLDYNIDSEEVVLTALHSAEAIGVSAYGAPYIPAALAFARRMLQTGVPIFVGGQAAQNLTREQFTQIFAGTHAVQIMNDVDLAQATGCKLEDLTNVLQVDMRQAYSVIPEHYWPVYMQGEMPLFISQGCAYRCKFCAAEKQRDEEHVLNASLANYLVWLTQKAASLKIDTLQFYATSLDLFQNPEKVQKHLRLIGSISTTTQTKIRLRGLTCLKSFLRASKLPDFAKLVGQCGLWSLGFGVDGTDDLVWKRQQKNQNKLSDVQACLALCKTLNIRPEILLVMGFPEDTAKTLAKMVVNAARFVRAAPNTMLRPYLAKACVPGNEGWSEDSDTVAQIVADPDLFYNLDFAALGSRLTHPRRTHRYSANAAYLAIIGLFTPLGNCDTPPLLPQGGGSWLGRRFARAYNRLLPADR